MNDALFPKVLLSIFFVSTDKGAEPTTAHKKKDKKTKKKQKKNTTYMMDVLASFCRKVPTE